MASYASATINTGYWGSYPLTSKVSFDATRSGNTISITNIIIYCTASNGWGSDNNWPKFTLLVGSTSIAYGQGLSMTAGEGVKTLSNATFTVGATATSATITFKVENGGTFTTNINITFPAGATAPSGLATQVTARTWNSATMKTSVSSWGTGAGPNRLVIHLSPTYNSDTYMRQAEASYSPFTATINNSTSTGTHQAFTMKGCHTLYPWIYAYNGSVEAKTWGSAFYLPPAPLQTLSKSAESYAGSNKSNVTISITGGNSTNNNNVTVTTQYRYSTNNGSTWTAWTSAGTGSPWTTKTASFQVPCNTSIQVQARQVYQSLSSDVKSLTFTSMKTPARLYIPVSSKSKLTRKLYIGVNNRSEKVIKLYKGVGGRAKLVYTG